jgi:hypothetical protein
MQRLRDAPQVASGSLAPPLAAPLQRSVGYNFKAASFFCSAWNLGRCVIRSSRAS